MAEEFGTGAIRSEEDPRDYQIMERFASDGIELASTFAASYTVPGLPPVLNQGTTPQCVAYSHSSMKAWHDRRDQGQWFNFNENLFFSQIGGTSRGAAARWALDRMKNYGYPVVITGAAAYHKIAAYYAVPKDISYIKQALLSYGPLTMIGPWYSSWTSNAASTGLIGGSWGTANGHATLVIGWNDSRGLYCQNSWGTGWGASGRFWMPYWHAMNVMWEFWKAVDQKIGPTNVTTTITATGVPMAGFTNRTGWKATIKAGKPRRAGASTTAKNYGNTDSNGEAWPIWGEVVGEDMSKYGLPGGRRWFFGPQYISGQKCVYVPYVDLTNRNF